MYRNDLAFSELVHQQKLDELHAWLGHRPRPVASDRDAWVGRSGRSETTPFHHASSLLKSVELAVGRVLLRLSLRMVRHARSTA